MTTITIDKIKKTFGVNQVLQDVSLDIANDEFLTLLGPSGYERQLC